MARLVITRTARADLSELVHTHVLPEDTLERVRESVDRLGDFPKMGAPLHGELGGRRFVVGPWQWMLIVYQWDESSDTVAILRIADGRSSASPRGK